MILLFIVEEASLVSSTFVDDLLAIDSQNIGNVAIKTWSLRESKAK